MLQDILTKQGYYILKENNEVHVDDNGHIFFFKTRDAAEQFMKKEQIEGIIK